MFFSICIPLYNREKLIGRTLDSLVDQTFKDFEVIVVDDGSTDESSKVVKKYEFNLDIRYFYKENGGKHSALNIGIEKAKGVFFIILDSDDWLKKDALYNIYNLCCKIINDDMYSGVLTRCIIPNSDKMLGKPFPSEPYISSYFDFHFISGRKKGFADCCDCNKTEILKQYKFPEDRRTKFVPEAWLFDQIGIKYKLLCSNTITEYRDLQDNGLSLDKNLKIKNNVGFLYHYISRIENVLPLKKTPLKVKIVAWWRYWEAVNLDKDKKGPRVKKVTLLGNMIKLFCPAIAFGYRIFYRNLYRKNR